MPLQTRAPALRDPLWYPCTLPTLSNTPCIKLSSNYPICMCHLFPAGTLTDTVFLICLCTISAYTLTPTHIYSLTHSCMRTHPCTHSVTRRHIPTTHTHTHPQTPTLANAHTILTRGSASSQLPALGCGVLWSTPCSGEQELPFAPLNWGTLRQFLLSEMLPFAHD